MLVVMFVPKTNFGQRIRGLGLSVCFLFWFCSDCDGFSHFVFSCLFVIFFLPCRPSGGRHRLGAGYSSSIVSTDRLGLFCVSVSYQHAFFFFFSVVQEVRPPSRRRSLGISEGVAANSKLGIQSFLQVRTYYMVCHVSSSQLAASTAWHAHICRGTDTQQKHRSYPS